MTGFNFHSSFRIVAVAPAESPSRFPESSIMSPGINMIPVSSFVFSPDLKVAENFAAGTPMIDTLPFVPDQTPPWNLSFGSSGLWPYDMNASKETAKAMSIFFIFWLFVQGECDTMRYICKYCCTTLTTFLPSDKLRI